MTAVKILGVVGAGTMGRGVAELAATRGMEVILMDKSGEAIDQARRLLDVALKHQIDKWSITEAEKRVIYDRIRFTRDISDMEQADFIIEAVVEELPEKRELFRTLDQICPKQAVLASNTSTLSITEMGAATYRPQRVLGLHFLQPVTRTRVVEMVRGLKTSDETVAAALAFLRQLDKTGVEVYESPGYITTRLMAPIINDAANIVMEGVATAEAVDTAMRLGYQMERGPLELGDRTGLDTLLVMLERLWQEFGDLRYRPSPLIRKLVRAGHLGVESGQGFFHYDADGNRQKEGQG